MTVVAPADAPAGRSASPTAAIAPAQSRRNHFEDPLISPNLPTAPTGPCECKWAQSLVQSPRPVAPPTRLMSGDASDEVGSRVQRQVALGRPARDDDRPLRGRAGHHPDRGRISCL